MSLGQKMITYVTQVSNRAMNISPGRSIPKHLSKACTTFRRFCHRVFVPKFESTEGEIDAVIRKLNNFVATNRGLFVLTGAGTSTESGIRDYRSEGVGLYAVSNNRPIQFKDFLKDADKRRSYWARNYVGWPEFSSREPNAGHLALARLEKLGVVHWLVTQNVDALHSKAGSRRVTELHGCSHRVVCLGCKEVTSRHKLQQTIHELNPDWKVVAEGSAPDGDTFLTEDIIGDFKVPECQSCGGILKPQVVFFGDSVPKHTVWSIFDRLDECDAVLVIGSSLEVYSSYRFVRAAWEHRKPIAILNIGPTRADKLATLKLSAVCGDVLPRLEVLSKWKRDPDLHKVKPELP